jgi:hypothetical protein
MRSFAVDSIKVSEIGAVYKEHWDRDEKLLEILKVKD